MNRLAFICAAAITALGTIAAYADTGCVEKVTRRVEETTCTQFSCVQQNAKTGSCVRWSCLNSTTRNYVDKNSSYCQRTANCGKATFVEGQPDEPTLESTEICDWYPCILADSDTDECSSYKCVSKRVFNSVHVTYTNALCVNQPPQQKQNSVQQRTAQNAGKMKQAEKKGTKNPPPPPQKQKSGNFIIGVAN